MPTQEDKVPPSPVPSVRAAAQFPFLRNDATEKFHAFWTRRLRRLVVLAKKRWVALVWSGWRFLGCFGGGCVSFWWLVVVCVISLVVLVVLCGSVHVILIWLLFDVSFWVAVFDGFRYEWRIHCDVPGFDALFFFFFFWDHQGFYLSVLFLWWTKKVE